MPLVNMSDCALVLGSIKRKVELESDVGDSEYLTLVKRYVSHLSMIECLVVSAL